MGILRALRQTLTSESTSPVALSVFAPIGVLLIGAATPVTLGSSGAASPMWWFVAIVVQAAFTFAVLSAHRRQLPSGPVIFAAGFVRGIVPTLAAPMLLGTTAETVDVFLAGFTSGVACLLWLGVIGGVLRARAEYRREYADLAQQAAQMRAMSDNDIGGVDPRMLEEWTRVRQRLEGTSKRIRRALGKGRVNADDVADAARTIQLTVDEEIRPLSHRLWQEAPPQPPSLGLRWIVRESLRPWRPSIPWILAITVPLLLVGAARASGIGVSLTITALTAASISLWLGASRVAARLLSRHQLAVGAVTCTLMPAVLTAVLVGLGEGVLGLPPDDTGALVISAISTVITLSVTIVRRLLLERQLLLDALARSIDADAVRLMSMWLDEQAARTRWGEHLHQSVQSELTAVATLLNLAAHDQDAQRRTLAVGDAVRRVSQIAGSTPDIPSRLEPVGAIISAVRSWNGLVDIEVDLDDYSPDKSAAWQLAARAVPEAVANSVRRGGAQWVSVTIRDSADGLVVQVRDDGHMDPSAPPGFGTAWLDRHLPGGWSRIREGDRSVLRMSIPCR